MASVVVRRSAPKPGAVDRNLAARKPIVFREFVVRSERVDAESVELWVSVEGKRPYALFEDHVGKPNVLKVV